MEDGKMDTGFFFIMPHKCSSEGSCVDFVNFNDVANICNKYICERDR